MESLTTFQLIIFLVSLALAGSTGFLISLKGVALRTEKLPYILLLLREYRKKHKLDVNLVFDPEGGGSLIYLQDGYPILIFTFKNVDDLVHQILVSLDKAKPK